MQARPADGPLQRLPAVLGLTAAGLFVAASLFRALQVNWLHFHSAGPLALENPMLAGIMLLRRGVSMYSPSVYADAPFIVQMYTPAYYYLAAALPEWPGAPYRTGRLLSATFMVSAALLPFALARTRQHVAPIAMLVAFFLGVYPVATNTLLVRQDPMALFFAVASIVVLAGRTPTARTTIASATLAVIAIAAKQSYVAASLAAVAYLAWTNRRLLRVYLMTSAGLVAAGAVSAHHAWGGAFWWSVIGTLPADFLPGQYSWLIRRMAGQATCLVFAGLVGAQIIAAVRHARGTNDTRTVPADPTSIYFAMAALVCVLTLPKDGASLNYFFEPMLAGVLFCASRTTKTEPRRLARLWLPGAAAAFLSALAIDVARAPVPPAFTSPERDAQTREYLHAWRADVAAIPGTGTDATVFVHPALRNPLPNLGYMPVLADDYLYAILIGDGRLDAGIFAEAVARRRFDLVVLPLEPPQRTMIGLGDAFLRALDEHYIEVPGTLHRYLVPRPEP